MYKHFGVQCKGGVLPILFEHKIANAFGCYQFFHTIISKPINRIEIDKILKNDIINFSNLIKL